MLRAGRFMLQGRTEEARARGRRAGFLAAAGGGALSVALALAGFVVPFLFALAAGAAALLGGLSGKPVPAAWFAAALLALSLLAALRHLV
jgi:predicted membrane metal-binding protein